ncbi:MAG: DUF3080 family protein [Thiolinea sp.]
MLEEYADSMGTVLETPVELNLEAAALDFPVLPERRERILPTVDIREGMLEVWDFQQCGMMKLIAERNSTLGKVMLPSQKMIYELRFMAALQQCRTKMQQLEKPTQQDKDFIRRLDEIHALKQQYLPAEIWNGIYTSEEISQHFALGKAPLSPQAESPVNELQAMEQLLTLAKLATAEPLQLPDWLAQLEDQYFALYSSQYGAELLPALRITTQTLERTAAAIEQRLQRAPFCHKGHRPRRAEILRNIFQKYYAGQVQPYMAQLQREGQHWLSIHQQIMQQLPVPPAMKVWQQQVVSLDVTDSLWQQWQQASQRHTQAWQDILGQCGMMPGQGEG